MPDINNVLIVGGTHGNELTGVYLVQHWLSTNSAPKPLTFTPHFMLANPEAIRQNRRYIERDLNRCFIQEELEDNSKTLLEEKLAKSITQKFGSSSDKPSDFIIDLHTTTSNMGITLVFHRKSSLIQKITQYVKNQIPNVSVVYEVRTEAQSPYLFSLGKAGGILVEIGPTPQGMVRADIFKAMQETVLVILQCLDKYNQNAIELDEASPLEVYKVVGKKQLPTDQAGNLLGTIHPKLQDQDYKLLKPGDPMFYFFSGETVVYQGEPVYPIFTNEAAYYDQAGGFSMTIKEKIPIMK